MTTNDDQQRATGYPEPDRLQGQNIMTHQTKLPEDIQEAINVVEIIISHTGLIDFENEKLKTLLSFAQNAQDKINEANSIITAQAARLINLKIQLAAADEVMHWAKHRIDLRAWQRETMSDSYIETPIDEYFSKYRTIKGE